MSLEVVGAGFGRTGTKSLKAALEQLGFGPCYHMSEIFSHSEHSRIWHDAADGKLPDWDALLNGYRAVVDWPACHFWRELVAAFPDAKVLLSVRDPEAWYKSISQTIFRAITDPSIFPSDPLQRERLLMAHHIVIELTFGGRLDKAHVIDVYRAHNDAVRNTVPKDRLLVYDVKEGWEPLCDFLGVAVPETEFPRTNSTQEFLDHVRVADEGQNR